MARDLGLNSGTSFSSMSTRTWSLLLSPMTTSAWFQIADGELAGADVDLEDLAVGQGPDDQAVELHLGALELAVGHRHGRLGHLLVGLPGDLDPVQVGEGLGERWPWTAWKA